MDRLISLMQQLRNPKGGCPWDIEQTHKSLLPYLIEECYELVEAIQLGDSQHIKEELGDVLFQVIFHAQIQAEQNNFGFNEVVETIVSKMRRRHPHVFDGVVYASDEEREEAWQAIKREEKNTHRDNSRHFFSSVSKFQPVLTRSEKLQKIAAKTGFDWPGYEPIAAKIEEELEEVIEVIEQKQGNQRLVEEVGDLLFAVTNLARHLGVDSEAALVQANQKFERRFSGVIDRLQKQGRTPEDASLEQMDLLWDEEKESER